MANSHARKYNIVSLVMTNTCSLVANSIAAVSTLWNSFDPIPLYKPATPSSCKIIRNDYMVVKYWRVDLPPVSPYFNYIRDLTTMYGKVNAVATSLLTAPNTK